MEKRKAGYSGEFYVMAIVTLNMIKYNEIGQLLLQCQLK